MQASPDQVLRIQKELIISMKFHQRNCLIELPRNLALQAMNEAYESVLAEKVVLPDTATIILF